jgi:hypothetical protein
LVKSNKTSSTLNNKQVQTLAQARTHSLVANQVQTLTAVVTL